MVRFTRQFIWLAWGASSTWAQTPTPTPSGILDDPGDIFDDLLGGSFSCATKSSDCMYNIWTMTDPPGCASNHCLCAAMQTDKYRDCVKSECPDTWEEYLDSNTFCDLAGIDPSEAANHTFTMDPLPSATGGFNFGQTSEDKGDGGLSTSDKIAIGIGVGLGVPTLVATLLAWLCARPRWKAKKLKEQETWETHENGVPDAVAR